MNTQQIKQGSKKTVKHAFTIEIMRNLTEDELQYIFDCWCEFWTSDFGYFPNEYTMVLQ